MNALSRATVGADPEISRASPTDSALTTPELLETILLHLDMRSLLTSALGVCRQWRDLVRASASLRRALFFEDNKAADSQSPVYNPLLAGLFPPMFNFAVSPKRDGIDDLAIEALPIGRRAKAFYRRNASWRRMHVRQPPVEHVGVWKCTTSMAWSYALKMLRYPAGLRMEGLYFWALKYSYEWQSSCRIHWSKAQKQNVWQSARVMESREPAEEMMQTADVMVTANWGGDCMSEFDERKTADEQGLVTIRGRWFRMKDDKDWEIIWEKEDMGLWD